MLDVKLDPEIADGIAIAVLKHDYKNAYRDLKKLESKVKINQENEDYWYLLKLTGAFRILFGYYLTREDLAKLDKEIEGEEKEEETK